MPNLLPLDKQLMKDWIAALRSGKYKQGYHQLHISFAGIPQDEFCCLGVLCEIAVEKKMLIRSSREHYTDAQTNDKLFTDLAGFKEKIGLPDGIEEYLVRLNDGQRDHSGHDIEATRKTFNEIADYIEKEILRGENN